MQLRRYVAHTPADLAPQPGKHAHPSKHGEEQEGEEGHPRLHLEHSRAVPADTLSRPSNTSPGSAAALDISPRGGSAPRLQLGLRRLLQQARVHVLAALRQLGQKPGVLLDGGQAEARGRIRHQDAPQQVSALGRHADMRR